MMTGFTVGNGGRDGLRAGIASCCPVGIKIQVSLPKASSQAVCEEAIAGNNNERTLTIRAVVVRSFILRIS